MNSITVAPARALYQEKATDLVAADIVAKTPSLWIGGRIDSSSAMVGLSLDLVLADNVDAHR